MPDLRCFSLYLRAAVPRVMHCTMHTPAGGVLVGWVRCDEFKLCLGMCNDLCLGTPLLRGEMLSCQTFVPRATFFRGDTIGIHVAIQTAQGCGHANHLLAWRPPLLIHLLYRVVLALMPGLHRTPRVVVAECLSCTCHALFNGVLS